MKMQTSDAYQLGTKVGMIIGPVFYLAIIGLLVVSIIQLCRDTGKSKIGWIIGLILSVGVVVAVVVVGVRGAKEAMTGASSESRKVIESDDKTFSLSVPASWEKMTLRADATFRAGTAIGKMFIVGLQEDKFLTGVDLEGVEHFQYEKLVTLGAPSIKPMRITVNGMPALERRFRMKTQGVDLSYARLTIESETKYFYITFWTVERKETAGYAVYESIRDSFHTGEGPPKPEPVIEMVSVKNAESRVTQIFVDQLGAEAKDLKPEASLKDLGADDLDQVELVMAIEEEFDLELSDEVAEKFLKVGDFIDYVKANAKIRADFPEIPASLPKSALLAPRFHGGAGGEHEAGSAFVCEVAPKELRLLTVHHLFGTAGGLEKELKWNVLEKEYPKATGVLYGSDAIGAEGARVLQLPKARSLDDATTAFDLAAYVVESPPTADVLPLAMTNAKVGEIVFLNSAYIGWTPAKVVRSDKDLLMYQFFLKKLAMQGTSGSPVVNLNGEVVAIHAGSGEGKAVFGMGNPCESIRAHLKAAEATTKLAPSSKPVEAE